MSKPVLCSLSTDRQTHTHESKCRGHPFSDSGFYDFLLQPIFNDRSKYVLSLRLSTNVPNSSIYVQISKIRYYIYIRLTVRKCKYTQLTLFLLPVDSNVSVKPGSVDNNKCVLIVDI